MVNHICTTFSGVNNRRLKGIFLLVSKSVRLNKLTPEQGHSSVFLNTNMLIQCEVALSLFPNTRGRFEKRQTTTSARGVFVLINLKLLHKDESERNGDNDSQRVFVMMISAQRVD